jgi:hypothetical protein
MNKAHSIQLIPTKAQKMLLHKSFGIARHSFNWALDVWQKQYRRGKKPSAEELRKSSLWRWFRTFGSKNFCEAGIII